ncbi:MAG: hypothetical protein IT445_06390 [Phycisphaeraceae bacterium]|nr:hypothetical protein [Phycisphaeraceae bacterium]
MIELLLATAIAAVLMGAVLTVTASLGRTQAAVESASSQTFAGAEFQPIFDLIQNDLAMTKSVTIAEGVLRIETLNRLAIDTSADSGPTGSGSAPFRGRRPMVVRYRLMESGTSDAPKLLVREQVPVGGNSADATRDSKVELLAMGIACFEVNSSENSSAEPPNSQATSSTPLPGAGAGAASVHIRIQRADAPKQLIERVIGGSP